MKYLAECNAAVRKERAADRKIIRRWIGHCEQAATGVETQPMLTAAQILKNVLDDIDGRVRRAQKREGGAGRR